MRLRRMRTARRARHGRRCRSPRSLRVQTSAPPAVQEPNQHDVSAAARVRDARGRPRHQAAFQAIAEANDDMGTAQPAPRVRGTASTTCGLLEDAGYVVTLDEFQFTFRRRSTSAAHADRRDHESGAYTGSGLGRRHRGRWSPSTSTSSRRVSTRADARRRTSPGCFDGPRRHRADPARDVPFGSRPRTQRPRARRRSSSSTRRTRSDRGSAHRPDTSARVGVGISVVGASFANGEALAAARVDRARHAWRPRRGPRST